jgi:DNA-directed RNA polymerase subunit RPC12/RpoP
MESRWCCDNCGGWIVEDPYTGTAQCETCGVKILPDGTVDWSECEDE